MAEGAPPTSSSRAIRLEALRSFTASAFRAVGMSETDSSIGAEVLATTDAWGVFTHGTKSLAGYLRRLQAGGLRARGRPQIASEGPAWATVNGDSSLGMVTSVFAMQTAIAKARQQGIAYVGVHNSCHFGAAGYYAWLAAREGLIGIAMANDRPSVAAPGSRGAITGSNPLAYAVPAGKRRPIFLDISTATVAGGKVYAARARGEPIPNNWIIDAHGQPTSDPSGFPQVGALLPMAGHKGYGLSLLIETLSGILSGAAVTWGVQSWSRGDAAQPTLHGAAFLAIDVKCIAPREEFARKVEDLIEEIHNSPRADAVERLLVPGELEWERYDRALRDGITLPSDVVENVKKAAEIAGVSPQWLEEQA
jgi:ureidoglycolate dehydrogenase (NAD+)